MIKILHLEDVAEDVEFIEDELLKGNLCFEKIVVDNKEDYEKGLSQFNPDVILSDHSLPSFDSFRALSFLTEKRLNIPFILVTATMSEEFAVAIMKEGAADYILKDRLQRLPSAIINSINKNRFEKEQHAANERLLFHIENAPVGFIEWDERGLVKSWSGRAEEIFGWTAKEAIEDVNHLSWASDLLKQLISGEVERNKVQQRSTTKDGRIIWCQWFNSVLKDNEGKVKTVMSLVQDISEQKQLEWQKDNFLAIVSHELNTPLTTIKAYGQLGEMMLTEKEDIETLDIVKRMSSQVEKLTILVENLLDFTKTQRGKLTYTKTFFDFNELVLEVIDDMQKINPSHKIKNKPGKVEVIFGDRNKLGQVINNLISNAIKYSPKEYSIVLSTQLENSGIQLSVQDFGIGISEKNQHNIFDQFYRVSRDDQSTFPGLGVGLYISSEIVSRHGGRIWVDSIIDKGSTFHAWIPLNHEVDM
jgi:PAS domain S-box-containing protein